MSVQTPVPVHLDGEEGFATSRHVYRNVKMVVSVWGRTPATVQLDGRVCSAKHRSVNKRASMGGDVFSQISATVDKVTRDLPVVLKLGDEDVTLKTTFYRSVKNKWCV